MENYVAQHYIENPYLIGGKMAVSAPALPWDGRSVSQQALISSPTWAQPDTRHDGVQRQNPSLHAPTSQPLPLRFPLPGMPFPLPSWFTKILFILQEPAPSCVYPTNIYKVPSQCQPSSRVLAHPVLLELTLQ